MYYTKRPPVEQAPSRVLGTFIDQSDKECTRKGDPMMKGLSRGTIRETGMSCRERDSLLLEGLSDDHIPESQNPDAGV